MPHHARAARIYADKDLVGYPLPTHSARTLYAPQQAQRVPQTWTCYRKTPASAAHRRTDTHLPPAARSHPDGKRRQSAASASDSPSHAHKTPRSDALRAGSTCYISFSLNSKNFARSFSLPSRRISAKHKTQPRYICGYFFATHSIHGIFISSKVHCNSRMDGHLPM